MDLSIIIINWKSREYLWKCLSSIRAHAPRLSFEVIVVDNASFDGCGEMIRREFPEVRFVQSEANLGFSGGNNLGVTISTGDRLLFLNPDTEVLPGALQELVLALDNVDLAGCVGARLLNADGTVQTSCIQRFPTILNQALDFDVLQRKFMSCSLFGLGPLFEKSSLTTEVEVVSGACLLVRRDVFVAADGFNEMFFMYSEDVDLSYCVNRLGRLNLYVPTAKIVHHGGGSSKVQSKDQFSSVMIRESRFRFFQVRRSKLYAAAYRLMIVGVSALRLGGLTMVAAVGWPIERSEAIASIQKWVRLLRWALGFEGWAGRQTHVSSPSLTGAASASTEVRIG